MTIEERQEAAKWFQNRASHTSMPGAKMMFKRAAEALSEGMQPQRIPCSERLPNEDEEVLVTSNSGIFIAVMSKVWDKTIHWFETVEGKSLHKVTAWMPLPKPYDGGDAK